MTPFLALIRKDLQLFFRDRRSWVMSFIAPIVIASFFGSVFGGGGPGNRKPARVPVGFVDEDHAAIGRALLASLQTSESLDIRPLDRAAAEAQVRTGKLSVAAILPKDFSNQAGRAFFRGAERKPTLEILYDPSRAAERQMVEGILTGQVMEAVSAEMFGNSPAAASLTEQSLKELDTSTLPESQRRNLKSLLNDVLRLQKEPQTGSSSPLGGSGMSIPFTTKAEAVTSRKGVEYNAVAHAFAGMGVQFILFMGIEAGVALLLQRQRGLWKRFRSAPVSKAVLLGSRAASAAFCSMLILGTMFLFARIVFNVRVEGSLPGFLLLALCFSLMTAAFGLLIAALGDTPEATRPIAALATLFMVMLGGSWMPTFLFPAWLQTATLIMPTRWAVDGLDAMTWRGLGFQSAITPALAMLGFTALFAVIAWTRFRWSTP